MICGRGKGKASHTIEVGGLLKCDAESRLSHATEERNYGGWTIPLNQTSICEVDATMCLPASTSYGTVPSRGYPEMCGNPECGLPTPLAGIMCLDEPLG